MRQKSILLGFLFYLLATAVILSSVSSPASAQLIKLNVGYSAISGEQLPAWIAKETRIFEKNGLDVQLIYFTGGSLAVLAVVSGEVPISQVAGPAVVNSALAGSDVIMVAAGATSLDYWLMSVPEIKKPDQLKGGSLAISRFGTASDFVARYALNEKSWELLADENMLPKKQYPSLEGIKFILAPLSEKDAKARAAKPEDFADLGFIKELDQSGYIDSLYKKK